MHTCAVWCYDLWVAYYNYGLHFYNVNLNVDIKPYSSWTQFGYQNNMCSLVCSLHLMPTELDKWLTVIFWQYCTKAPNLLWDFFMTNWIIGALVNNHFRVGDYHRFSKILFCMLHKNMHILIALLCTANNKNLYTIGFVCAQNNKIFVLCLYSKQHMSYMREYVMW